MLRDLELVVDAVESWRTLGRDVVVRGDDGSGRSTVLRAVADRMTDRGARVVTLRAAGPRENATLLAHPSFPPTLATASCLEQVNWLVEELSGPGATLVIDDADRLDRGSAETVRQALTRTGAGLVLSAAGRRVEPEGDCFIAAVVAERAPADVRIRPLGLASLARLVGDALGGPGDLPLVASVAARSAGNPRVAAALVDGARYTGAIESEGGRWRSVGAVEQVPLDPVVNAFVPRMTAAEVDALELLSAAGPLPLDAAERLLTPEVLHDLAERGRVVRSRDAHGTRCLVVSPPALATALRTGLSEQRRAELAERAGAVDPRLRRTDLGRPAPLEALFVSGPEHTEAGAEWLAGLAAQIEEHEIARVAARRAAWLTDPSVHTARPYLDLLTRRPDDDDLAQVFRCTPVTEADDPAERALFRADQLAWSRATERSTAVADELARRHAADLAPLVELRRQRERLVAGCSVDEVLDRVPPLEQGLGAVLTVVSLVGALVEAGRPEEAVVFAESDRPGAISRVFGHQLSGLYGLALVQLGEVEEAGARSRELLSAACEGLDAVGIRVQASVLAESLLRQGRAEEAWAAAGAALHLGSRGVAAEPFHRRSLSLAAAARSRIGDPVGASELVAELRSLPVADDALAPVPVAADLLPSAADLAGAAELSA
ncbi:hypothetical protein [Cellulomonas denverensis]|uniref:hypothetical protein n=1 Tax=Cellulomonas denverensis TaxID=264297 RepID=UPI0035E71B9B